MASVFERKKNHKTLYCICLFSYFILLFTRLLSLFSFILLLMSRGSRCRCGTHLRPETMTHTHAACYQCQPASAHTINLPLNDKMIIHTHNGELFEMHSGCVRVPQRFATKKWNENGQKTNRGPNGILFMVFFVHVDLLRCPSPVPLPPPLPLTTTTKTTFMKFVLFHVLLDVEW